METQNTFPNDILSIPVIPAPAVEDKQGRHRLYKKLRSFAIYVLLLVHFYIFILKWLPVPYTLTMLQRKISCRGCSIDYQWVSYEDMSPYVKIAAVASEDQRFPSHWGIDREAVRQAYRENQWRKKRGLPLRGGSSISQQVAKNVFLWQGGGYFRKALEVYFTYAIELIWGKQRILEVYLNVAETGPRCFGVEAAARRYFHKPARKLNLYESALLIAGLPNPIRWNPGRPSAWLYRRQQHIIRQVHLLGGYAYLRDLRRF
ncbi:MAG: monofunctional biosynthetic peptidoglycan transglycosylase [Thermonema sp.]|uniref:monofunctional biosynthetic peptidoglycan transglycosylase n=1 Tax=Thermonema sp. TaxID=2231181 RepID=UPI0021DE3260|nr:monofunctional biosynthetic peptidoglycan transglycosylase [Thermonema sp.]GIV39972.1 MAG: monofunctional biosynthetic peptidoglycan transglycosylase [Thermonema sp.]